MAPVLASYHKRGGTAHSKEPSFQYSIAVNWTHLYHNLLRAAIDRLAETKLILHQSTVQEPNYQGCIPEMYAHMSQQGHHQLLAGQGTVKTSSLVVAIPLGTV